MPRHLSMPRQTSMLTDATLSPGRAFGIVAGVTLLSNTVSAAACP
jgi:hypothetical protein